MRGALAEQAATMHIVARHRMAKVQAILQRQPPAERSADIPEALRGMPETKEKVKRYRVQNVRAWWEQWWWTDIQTINAPQELYASHPSSTHPRLTRWAQQARAAEEDTSSPRSEVQGAPFFNRTWEGLAALCTANGEYPLLKCCRNEGMASTLSHALSDPKTGQWGHEEQRLYSEIRKLFPALKGPTAYEASPGRSSSHAVINQIHKDHLSSKGSFITTLFRSASRTSKAIQQQLAQVMPNHCPDKLHITAASQSFTAALRHAATSKDQQMGGGTTPATDCSPPNRYTERPTHWAWIHSANLSRRQLEAWAGGVPYPREGTRADTWMINISTTDITGDPQGALPPGGIIHGEEAFLAQGWQATGRQHVSLAICWKGEVETKKRRPQSTLYATNVQGLTEEKMRELETWIATEARDAYAIGLSEVKRRTGRRTIGGLSARWSLTETGQQGVGILLSKQAVAQSLGPTQIIVEGRLLRDDFRGHMGIWTLLTPYGPQAGERTKLEQYWKAVRRQIRLAYAEKRGLIINGDVNATPHPSGRDGPSHAGDKQLRRTLTEYPELEDVGPRGRTHIHRAKDSGITLNSSRIDVILALQRDGVLLKPGTAYSFDVPYTTTHKAVAIQLEETAHIIHPTKQVQFKHPIPRATKPDARAYADATGKRKKG
eukprot:gene1949-15020_t